MMDYNRSRIPGIVPNKLPIVVDRKEYLFSQIVWMLNAVCPVLMLFAGNPFLWAEGVMNRAELLFAAFFALTVLQSIGAGKVMGSRSQRVPEGMRTRFDTVLMFARTLAIVLNVGCLAMLFLSGGGPDIMNGVVCISSHGDFVREISEKYFCFLSYCERWLFGGGAILIFSVEIAIYKRALYLNREQRRAQREAV